MDQGVDDLFPLLAFNPKISPQSAQRPQRATVSQRIRETRLFRNFWISSRHFTFEGLKYLGFLCVLCVLCGSNARSGFNRRRNSPCARLRR